MSAFEAQYHGRCAAECGSAIEPGDEVVYVNDELVHVECEGAELRRVVKEEKTCTVCWLIMPGSCEDGGTAA